MGQRLQAAGAWGPGLLGGREGQQLMLPEEPHAGGDSRGRWKSAPLVPGRPGLWRAGGGSEGGKILRSLNAPRAARPAPAPGLLLCKRASFAECVGTPLPGPRPPRRQEAGPGFLPVAFEGRERLPVLVRVSGEESRALGGRTLAVRERDGCVLAPGAVVWLPELPSQTVLWFPTLLRRCAFEVLFLTRTSKPVSGGWDEGAGSHPRRDVWVSTGQTRPDLPAAAPPPAGRCSVTRPRADGAADRQEPSVGNPWSCPQPGNWAGRWPRLLSSQLQAQ